MFNKENNEKKLNNKGFSLVELIIVMAIMAILVGVVGTQVIPYMNQAKESKDYQVVSSFATAAMTAYANNVALTDAPTSTSDVTISIYTSSATSGFEKAFVDEVKNLTYADATAMQSAMGSDAGKSITDIKVTISVADRKITVQAIEVSGTGDAATTTNKFDPVVSPM